MIEKVGSRKEFDWAAVCDFQNTADDFCDIYCELTGRDGMTNNFHSFRSGHYAYFLHHKKNLYRYSQQGWEALNGKMKRCFNHNTQKGGGKNGSSKLLPIFMSFSPGFLWRCGILDAFFDKVDPIPKGGIDIKYGAVPKRFYDKNVDQDTVNAFTNTIMDIGSPDDVFGLFEDAHFAEDNDETAETILAIMNYDDEEAGIYEHEDDVMDKGI